MLFDRAFEQHYRPDNQSRTKVTSFSYHDAGSRHAIHFERLSGHECRRARGKEQSRADDVLRCRGLAPLVVKRRIKAI